MNSLLDIFFCPDEYLPGVAVACGNAIDGDGLCGNGFLCELGVGTGAKKQVVHGCTVNGVVYVAVGGAGLGESGAGLVLGCEGSSAIGISDAYVLHFHQIPAVTGNVVLCHIEEVNGVYLAHIVGGEDAHVLFPLLGGHTSDAAIILVAELWLLSVTTYTKIFEVDKNLLSYAEEGKESRSVDAHNHGTGSILHANLLVDVTADIVTDDGTFELQVIGDTLESAGINNTAVGGLKLVDGHKFGF